MKMLTVLAIIASSMSYAHGQCPNNCPPVVQSNEIYAVGTYTNCQPNYTQTFYCAFERGADFWLKNGGQIDHNQIDKINATWNLPNGSQFLQGTGFLRIFLIDSSAYTKGFNDPMVRVVNQLNYRQVETFGLNYSVVFDQNVYNVAKSNCDKLAAQYIKDSTSDTPVH